MKKYVIGILTNVIILIVLLNSHNVYALEEKPTFDVFYIERDFFYTGQEIDFSRIISVVDKDGNTLVKDADYITNCYDNVNAGEGTLIVTGIGAHTGTRTIKFNITKAQLKTVTIKEIPEQEYTGDIICPELDIKFMNNVLKKDVDYTVSFSNNTDCGIANAEITGIGNYEGTIRSNFRIINSGEKKKISEVSAYSIPQSYSGMPVELDIITVKNIYGDILEKDKDYNIEYSNNVNAGNASLIVSGKGDYEGTIVYKFEIVPIHLRNVSIEDIEEQKYTGKEICPKIKASYNDMVLIEGVDYKVEYINNTGIGTAKIQLTGMGNYKGKVTKRFKIKKSDVHKKYKQTIKAENVTRTFGKKSFDLKVTVKGNAKLKFVSSNTKVVTVSSKGKVIVKGAGKSIIKIVSLETDRYKKAEKEVIVSILPQSPEFSLSATGNRRIKIKWTEGSGIGENLSLCKYYIKYSSDKNFKDSKTLAVKGKNSGITVADLKEGKVYYIKMRTFSTDLKKYSSWSKCKRISV